MATSSTTTTGSSWLTLDEIAADLRIPLSTIYQWRTAGRGPKGIKVGKHIRVGRAAYETWLASLQERQ